MFQHLLFLSFSASARALVTAPCTTLLACLAAVWRCVILVPWPEFKAKRGIASIQVHYTPKIGGIPPIAMDTQEVIEKIKYVRKHKGLTQQKMAELLGYNDAKDYSRIETGERRLTLELLDAIAQVFSMTMIGLLSFDEKASFNQCTGAMSVHGDNTYHEANAALVVELKERIKAQQEEIAFLRGQVERLVVAK